jgi:hypothetical protein
VTTLRVMKRLAVTVIVALSLVGCGFADRFSVFPRGSLIAFDMGKDGWCFIAPASGRLVADPEGFVTAVDPEEFDKGTLSQRTIVAWPAGYGWSSNGSEVDVLDAQGRVVATTGNWYNFMGGYVHSGDRSVGVPKNLPATVWWACGPLELVP